jgi:1-piperideine-2-carboxylate/1-pyrroline-2-carboxylate reductase [NAD(P)H]
VIAVTTSTEAVYDEPALRDRLVIGVGAFRPDMAEIGKTTLDGSDLYADDPAGARHEAGDLIQAGIDWSRVRSLAAALQGRIDAAHPRVFKSVGTAAWDLAAARVALAAVRAA